MYALAENLAIHEMKKFDARINFENLYKETFHTGQPEDITEIDKKIWAYRDERIKFHMQEMKEILYKHLETQQKTKGSK